MNQITKYGIKVGEFYVHPVGFVHYSRRKARPHAMLFPTASHAQAAIDDPSWHNDPDGVALGSIRTMDLFLEDMLRKPPRPTHRVAPPTLKAQWHADKYMTK